MASELSGQKVAFVVAREGVEEVELTEPWKAVKDAGASPELIAPESGVVQTMRHLDKARTYPVDRSLSDARPSEYAAVVLPGGVANPDQLRTDHRAIEFLRAIFSEGKPIGVICHGPWTLVEADLVRGRTLTSWPSLQTDIRNAGGNWVDEEVVSDGQLTSSRKPDDLPAFCARIVEEFTRGARELESVTSSNGGAAASAR